MADNHEPYSNLEVAAPDPNDRAASAPERDLSADSPQPTNEKWPLQDVRFLFLGQAANSY